MPFSIRHTVSAIQEVTARTSIDYAEAHFDAKAERYWRALLAVPEARTLELIPFILLLNDRCAFNPTSSQLADLLCGSGFLTNALRRVFRRIDGVDVSSRMLAYYPVAPDLHRHKSGLDGHSNILGKVIKPDAIVSLAGLHHVYEKQGRQVVDSLSRILQGNVVESWASSLKPHGILVLADVTEPRLDIRYTSNQRILERHADPLSDRYTSLMASLSTTIGNGSFENYPSTLKEYASRVLDLTPDCAQASPGRWFREVVEVKGLYGHEDHFLYPDDLIEVMRRDGYKAEYYEIPTPWLFPSADDFIFFFHEKFSLGPPANTLDDISSNMRDQIIRLAGDHLGLSDLPGGGIASGWRLGYYVIAPLTSEKR